MNNKGCRLRVRLGGERARREARAVVVVDDPGALRALRAAEVLEAVGTLRALARRWSGDWATAEDLLQETIERAFRTLDTYKPGTSAGAWMRTIMYRLAVDESRRVRRERRVQRVFAAEAPVEVQAQEPEPTEEDARPSLAEVHAAARLLREPFRTAFQLWAVEGRSYVEISKLMGVPISTVATRLLRARRNLQEAFQAHGGGRRRPRTRQRVRCSARPGPAEEVTSAASPGPG